MKQNGTVRVALFGSLVSGSTLAAQAKDVAVDATGSAN